MRIVTDPGESALDTAKEILHHLAAGELEAAAALSNAAQRRLEVLREYRAQVGEAQFKRVYARYFAPQNRPLVEVALGRRRLVIWDLAEAGNHLAGLYLVEAQNRRFVLDDVPSEERRQLARVLQDYRRNTHR